MDMNSLAEALKGERLFLVGAAGGADLGRRHGAGLALDRRTGHQREHAVRPVLAPAVRNVKATRVEELQPAKPH